MSTPVKTIQEKFRTLSELNVSVFCMDKNVFDSWNEKKKLTHFVGKRPYFNKGEIWWAQLGQNISTEIFGKGKDFLRPVVILQIVYGNACLVLPLTSADRRGDYYCSFLDSKGNVQCALLAQVRYLDGKRLKHKQSAVGANNLEKLRIAFCKLINK